MSRLFRALKEVVQRFSVSQKEEILQLKELVEQQRLQLLQIKRDRELRKKYEEELILLHLKDFSNSLKKAEEIQRSHQQKVLEAFSEVKRSSTQKMTADMEAKATMILEHIQKLGRQESAGVAAAASETPTDEKSKTKKSVMSSKEGETT